MLHLVADLEAAYARFLKRTVAADAAWVLVSPEGKGAVVDSQRLEGADGLPLSCELVFSAEPLARRLANDGWADYQPRRLTLEAYLRVLPRFGGTVIPDPTADCAGVEVLPGALAAAIAAQRNGETPDLTHLSAAPED